MCTSGEKHGEDSFCVVYRTDVVQVFCQCAASGQVGDKLSYLVLRQLTLAQTPNEPTVQLRVLAPCGYRLTTFKSIVCLRLCLSFVKNHQKKHVKQLLGPYFKVVF